MRMGKKRKRSMKENEVLMEVLPCYDENGPSLADDPLIRESFEKALKRKNGK
jgi:hypothetical protein